ncbi:MAG: ATP-dependent zinc metalloprotease FtsH [Planctomycetaceae bacterium]
MSSPLPNDRENSNDSRRTNGANRPFFSVSSILMMLVVIPVALFLSSLFSNSAQQVEYGFLWQQIAAGNVERAVFQGEVVRGKFKKAPPKATKDAPDVKESLKDTFEVYLPIPLDHGILDHMRQHGVQIVGKPESSWANGMALLINLLSLLLFVGFMWFIMRRNSDPFSSGMLGNFIRSPAKRVKPSDHPTTFDDVAAMEQAKFELQEIVEFLKTPAKFLRLGAQIPKGVLLIGPPGTGKTLLARATAGEAGVPFFTINGSEFIQMFVGVGASRVRDMFKTAKENAPCILFIDEIDAVGRVRGAGLGGGNDEREQTLNQILSEMDGFQQTEAVIIVAATNRPDVLDPALLRPGRFDRHVTVDRPTKTGRAEILKVHSRKVPLADDVNLNEIAAGTIGFSGAELKNLVNEAALHAARTNRETVLASDFDAARDKILMGNKREEVLNERERLMTAYHESGHALLAWLLSDVDHVHKVTIIPRGRALGVTQLVPDEDRYNIGEARLHSQLAFMLGGRAAEKMIFDEFSAGAEDDLKRATKMARRMVTRWGMSTIIGPVAFRDSEEHPFLGKEVQESRDYSEETARIIDQEVQKFLLEADKRAIQVLTENRDKLEAMTKALVEKESLDQNEIAEIIGIAAQRD